MRIDSSSIASATLDLTLRAARAQAAKASRTQQEASAPTTAEAVETAGAKPTGPDGRPGFAHGIQKLIEAGRYVPAASNSRVGAALAQAGITAPSDAPDDVEAPESPEAPEGVNTGLLYSTADVELLNSAYRTNAGDDGFIAEYDFNSDGTIDGSDLSFLLANIGQPRAAGEASPLEGAFTSADIEALKQEWGEVDAESRAASRYDFNADGRIDGEDLAALVAQLNPDADTPQLDGPLAEEPLSRVDPTLDETPDDVAVTAPAVETVSFEEAIAGVDIGELSEALASEPESPSRLDLLAQLRSQLTDLINTGSADATQPTLLDLLTRLSDTE